MLLRMNTIRTRINRRKWQGFLCILIFCLNARVEAAWKENCQSTYDPLAISPALPMALRIPENKGTAVASSLEKRLYELLQSESQKPAPLWNATGTQDLSREVQEFLFQQKPNSAFPSLRRYWLLLMLAQGQWDILEAALKKQPDTLTPWLKAETSLGQRRYGDTLRLLHQSRDQGLALWLAWRRMETLFLLGQSEGALEEMEAVLGSTLLQDQRVRDKFQTFVQAFVVRGRALRPLLHQLQSKADHDALGQAVFCILTVSKETDDRDAALDAMLRFPKPSSQSLRWVSRQLEKSLPAPMPLDGILTRIEAYTEHAVTRLRQRWDAESPQDAFAFVQTQRKAGVYLLGQRSVLESKGRMERLDRILQASVAALPENIAAAALWALRARIHELSQRPAEAARIYRELALKAPKAADQRYYANQMLQNFGLATVTLVSDPSFMDACHIYQKLVPDAHKELSRCDLMTAHQALQQGQEAEARQKLWQIVYAFPHSVEGQTAADRLLELARKSPEDLYRTSDKLLSIRSFQTGPWVHKLRDLRRLSSYQRIPQLSSPDDQAEAYYVFSQKEKGHALASESLLKAVDMDQKAGRLARAIDRLETWLHDYPGSPHAPARLLDLVSMTENAMQIPRARRYLQWASSYQWSPSQKDFIQQKSCLFDILEQPLLAVQSCPRLESHITQGPALRLRLARALAYGAYSEELYRYTREHLIPRDDLSVDQKIMALDLLRRATSLIPARDEDLRTTMTNYYLEQSESLGPESRRILGSLAYQAAQKTLAAFMAMPIYGSRSDELIGSIQAKKQAYDEIDALYQKVLQTRDPHWGSSALCDLALAAENFAEALSRIPEIEGLDRKKIMSQIASQIASWRAKAKSLSGAAGKTIEKFEILHADNPRIIQESRRLKDEVIQFDDWIPGLEEAEVPNHRTIPWTRWDEAAQALLESSQFNAGVPPSTLLIKAIHFTLHNRDFVRAEWLIERLMQSPDPLTQSLGLWHAGRLQARLDHFGQTEELWKKALKLEPENRELRKQLGLLYARSGFFAKAYGLLKGIEGDAQVDWTLVAVERQLELNEPAAHRCERLTAVSNASPEAFYNCSLLEFQNHRYASTAISWMEAALQRADQNPALAAAARKQLALMQNWKARFQPDR
jgi:hypothetical protein